ncbi:hypothetical protein G4B88_000950 [Cannabis sativa]|uniref:Uncharacterized protein n=1 Tax=Cannabis sativa TaxID=3483 RepID=A0A7J6EZ51_CANSA|nr:hypothetical protein G4B88_000950 [Cannabis sativa]
MRGRLLCLVLLRKREDITNHIEKLDPTLLRCGRMDVHNKTNDVVLGDIETFIEIAQMTPVNVSEILIKNRRDRAKAIFELLEVSKVKAKGY